MGSGNAPEHIYDGFTTQGSPDINSTSYGTRTTSSTSSTDPQSSGDEGGLGVNFPWTHPLATPIQPFDDAQRQRQKQSSIPSCWSRQNVLSLDGGGIRGLTELLILQEIMASIKKLEMKIDGTTSSADSPLRDDLGNDEEREDTDAYLPCHYWDYVGGTSMGGVIAVMIGRLRCPVSQAIQYYKTIWDTMAQEINRFDRLLPGTRKKRTKADCSSGLQKALDKILAHHVSGSRQDTDFQPSRKPSSRKDEVAFFHSDLHQTKTLVLAVQIDKKNAVRRPFLLRTYSFKDAIEYIDGTSLDAIALSDGSSPRSTATSINRNVQSKTDGVTIKEVCLATSASRKYFQSVTIGKDQFIDGSDWMANPSMELYREVHSMHYGMKSPIYCFVSIGCGTQKRRSIIGPSMHLSSYQREQRKVDQVLTSRMQFGESFSYFRFDGPADLIDIKPSDWAMANNREKIVERIVDATRSFCQTADVRRKIEAIANTLVEYRRQRARTAMWEKFALGVQYNCRWCDEARDLDRDLLIAHVRRKHKEQIRSYDKYDTVLENTRVENTL